eukprot:GFKZ01003166.1.p1 GENE.GFKZ01003166.1~~GFKZ01003166.1.p1  ORF type:complete len:371 (+),score=32.31 GFKZ01003166.1:22-1134(+)
MYQRQYQDHRRLRIAPLCLFHSGDTVGLRLSQLAMTFSWVTPVSALLSANMKPRTIASTPTSHSRLPFFSHCPVSRARTHRRPRTHPAMSSLSGPSSSDTLLIQIVTVPDEKYMLTPGEVRQVALDYALFASILQTGTTAFGCIPVGEWATAPDLVTRGSLLSILRVNNIVKDSHADDSDAASIMPKVMVECKCSGRFDVLRLTDYDFVAGVDSPPQLWKLVHGECRSVQDWSCWEFKDRLKLATLEWNVWQSCREVASLTRKLGDITDPADAMPIVEQELAVWAPKNYDREVSESEWKDTPVVTRAVWCQRAESFSFGILRCVTGGDEHVMRTARSLTDTSARLELAMECVEKKKAMTQARISLKNALN